MKQLMKQIIAFWANVWQRENRRTKTAEVKTSAIHSHPVERLQAGTVALTDRVTHFLQSTYQLRYNLLTEEVEFRPLNKPESLFLPVGKRELNSFCLEAHARGISCWDKDISRYLYSNSVNGYHPFELYLDELPVWDGADRLEALARRVSTDSLWIKGFHTWMLALVAQWQGSTKFRSHIIQPSTN